MARRTRPELWARVWAWVAFVGNPVRAIRRRLASSDHPTDFVH